MKFIFPNDVQSFVTIKGIDDLRAKINSALMHEGRFEILKYKLLVRGTHYIYAKCSYCMASFKYHNLQLKFINNNHQHPHQRTHKSKIMDQIKELLQMAPLYSVRNLIIKKFGISTSTFYKYHSQLFPLDFPF